MKIALCNAMARRIKSNTLEPCSLAFLTLRCLVSPIGFPKLRPVDPRDSQTHELQGGAAHSSPRGFIPRMYERARRKPLEVLISSMWLTEATSRPTAAYPRPRAPSSLSRSPNFAHRAPRCATRDYLRALARPPWRTRRPLKKGGTPAQAAMRDARLSSRPWG